MFFMILVLVFLMAGGSKSGKRGRSPTTPPPAPPSKDIESDYVPEDEDSADSTDWENLPIETLSRPLAQKGKGKKKVSEKEKGTKKLTAKETGKKKVVDKGKGKGLAKEKVSSGHGRKKSIGIEIREPALDSSSSGSPEHGIHDASISSKRRSMYSSKLCVGEHNVGVPQLIRHVPALQALFESGDLYSICDFKEQTGYGLKLIREFYMRAGFLEDAEGGPFSFKTSVRGVDMTISPAEIGSVLGMVANTDGIEYLSSGFDAVGDWRKIMDGISVPNTLSNGILVMSKDLKIEYRFLNFVVCYNIMPLVNTKIVRWDRMLYMYLLGHPDIVRSRNINLNVPFLVWRRMAKDVKTSCQADRLPFPMLIMRLLAKFKVNTTCSSYEHSLGVISETTLAKSSSQLQSEIRKSSTQVHTVAPPQASTRAAAPGPSQPAPSDEISLSTLYHEQQRLSTEVGRLSTEIAKMKRMLKAIFDKLGCCSTDLPTSGADSG